MKICPVCNTNQLDHVAFCSNCGYSFLAAQNLGYTPEKISNSRRVMIGLAGIFFGFLGVHKFMAERPTAGFFHLALSLVGIFMSLAIYQDLYFAVPFIGLSETIGVIEGIRYLCLSNEHFQEMLTRPYRRQF